MTSARAASSSQYLSHHSPLTIKKVWISCHPVDFIMRTFVEPPRKLVEHPCMSVRGLQHQPEMYAWSAALWSTSSAVRCLRFPQLLLILLQLASHRVLRVQKHCATADSVKQQSMTNGTSNGTQSGEDTRQADSNGSMRHIYTRTISVTIRHLHCACWCCTMQCVGKLGVS